jgi:ABC-2 type transport system permease protein
MGTLTGTHHLVRLILRRDRIRLPLWLLGITGMTAFSGAAVKATYDSPESLASYASTVGNSAVGRLNSGHQVALDTIDGIVANEVTIVTNLGVALMVVFLVVRHTRAEEESGRAELLRAGILGRHAAPLAVGLVAVAASVLLGAALTAVLLGVGLDRAGAVAFGAEHVVIGLFFAAVAAAASQVTYGARGALGIAGGVVGVTYILRSLGAMAESWLYWVSPFGWAQGVDAFGDERWWPLAVVTVAAAAVFGLAAVLVSTRDAGAGLVQPRPGNPRASTGLGTPFGLGLRLQRGLMVGWLVGLAALAAVYAASVPLIPDMLEGNPEMAEMLRISGTEDVVIDQFLAYINVTLGVFGCIFGVASVLRLRVEEDNDRAEALLATRLSRRRWITGTLAVTVLGLGVIALGMGLAMVVGYLGVADASRSGALLVGVLAQLPAMLLVAAAAFLVVAWLPRLTIWVWAIVTFIAVDAMLGETLRLPDAVRGISPYFHLPPYPSESWSATPGLVLLGLALMAAVVGLVGYQRRDIGR